MRRTRASNEIWPLHLGMLLLTVIVAVVVWSEYRSYYLATCIILCAGGFVFWFVGFASTRQGASARPQAKSDLIVNSGELYLREFYLNGHPFQPYEQETPSGRRQFRLSSRPQMTPDREAAVIRYLITEGLSEKMWPQISRRIEEEANWAFFA
jgi:hypothetical protein